MLGNRGFCEGLKSIFEMTEAASLDLLLTHIYSRRRSFVFGNVNRIMLISEPTTDSRKSVLSSHSRISLLENAHTTKTSK